MADPTTTNVLLAVPTRGSDSGTWDIPVNANSTAADGYFGGVVSISLASSPVTLTAPSGTVTPGAGPYQSQNKILKFTGALSANVTVTLPLPGEYTIQNLTTGAYVVTFTTPGAGKVVATPQGSVMKIWNDGTDVWLIKNAIPGELKFMGGVSAVPAWITACSVLPYLLCDGSVYNYSSYSALGNLYGGSFGGNGITTFGVEDLRGRVHLAYDGTGTRIKTAGCGINGQTLGAAGGAQDITIVRANLPNTNVAVTVTDPGHSHTIPFGASSQALGGSPPATVNTSGSATTGTSTTGITAAFNLNGNVTQSTVQTVPPAQVSGIWLVAT